MRRLCTFGMVMALSAGCSQPAPPASDAPKPATAAKLGVRPQGDTEIQPDMSQVPPELQKVFAHIDENIDEHVENLQKWIQQPSISNSGEGIPESRRDGEGLLRRARLPADAGLRRRASPSTARPPTRWSTPSATRAPRRRCSIYWMYDTMPVTQPDAWQHPPFEARLVEQAPFKKVLIGRGATNSKGPQMSQLNAFRAIKAVHGKLPVNLIFVAEGDEERMDIGLRKFVKDHPELLEGADAMLLFGGQSPSGGGGYGGGSEGCVYVELTTSGTSWGRGPTVSDIHGSNKRGVDSPAWRHIKMLASLVSDDGNTPQIDGFFDGMPPIAEAGRELQGRGAEHRPEGGGREPRRRALHVGRPLHDAEDAALTARRSTWTASGAATCMRAAPAPSCPTRSPRSTTSATCPT